MLTESEPAFLCFKVVLEGNKKRASKSKNLRTTRKLWIPDAHTPVCFGFPVGHAPTTLSIISLSFQHLLK